MATDKEQTAIVKKEMGLTHKEFYQELPRLLSGISYHHGEDRIKFQLNGKKAEISLEPERSRQLGRSVRLPVTLHRILTLSFD
ncbi:MAG: hypothetical protein PF495_10655 [Spirochaetales bacterium]|jgi:hypothetical protein|nr:hypothetical protein [Spirochaetales bacterium]